MEVKGNGLKVCVTGASGYIASWVVKFLLDAGYTVNATVRDPGDERKTGHLVALPGAKERLNLFKADLAEDGCFDPAVSGCVGVFHVASPVILGFDVENPQVEILDPAIKGTLNVLASCKKSPSVRRVVLTSSISAVMYAYPAQNRTPEAVVDESWFSDPEICKKESKMMWYSLSKTLAEEAAWKFAKENHIDMVSINPAVVIGPMLQPTLNDSVAIILNLINGSKTYPNATFGYVNIKDVANAHILAFENPSANGRYCLVETVSHHSQTVKLLQELYPKLALPDKCQDDNPFVPTYQVSKAKAKSLGIEFVPFKVSLMETVQDLKEKGFVRFEE